LTATAGEDFTEFVRSRGTDLFRLAVLLAGEVGGGEDLFLSTLERVYARQSRGGHIDDHFAYARQVMVRLAQRRWRLRQQRQEVLVPQPPERAVDGSEHLVGARQDLVAALAELTRQQRAVIVLRYFGDLSEVDTARHLGCSVGTVKAHASRGLQRLRATGLGAPDPSLERS
jgi:RNA polymerase sigma-70 factor (sigma-E family)